MSREQPTPARRQLLLTAMDTTWRMVLPSLILVVAGLVADRRWSTAPWLTLLGVALGLACSAYLISVQLRGIE